MELNAFDIGIFVAFIAVVVGVSMFKSRRERTSEDYFLAGRGLTWPLIGLSIIAANISTEQFVGMSGQGAGSVGLAVSNWQLAGSIGIWLAARRLHQGSFLWPAPGNDHWPLESAQLDALVLGLPWQRLGDAGIITMV